VDCLGDVDKRPSEPDGALARAQPPTASGHGGSPTGSGRQGEHGEIILRLTEAWESVWQSDDGGEVATVVALDGR
jgi:hypothetical protein